MLTPAPAARPAHARYASAGHVAAGQRRCCWAANRRLGLLAGEEDPVALLPHLGHEARLAGLVGGEREAAHLDGP